MVILLGKFPEAWNLFLAQAYLSHNLRKKQQGMERPLLDDRQGMISGRSNIDEVLFGARLRALQYDRYLSLQRVKCLRT